MFVDTFGNKQIFPWRRDIFEIDYIQYIVRTGNKTELFNLTELSNQNTAELIAVGDHHYVIGETIENLS